MITSCILRQVPLTPQRRSAYPRWTRQASPQKREFSKTRTDIYQIVTDLIITTLEVGVKP